jgi:hypothetical protein
MFFTQITMDAADDPEYLQAMKRARVKGALVGIESVTPEGLKAVYKEFNSAGADLVEKLRTFVEHDVRILGSFIFGLSTDRPDTLLPPGACARGGIDFAVRHFLNFPERWIFRLHRSTSRASMSTHSSELLLIPRISVQASFPPGDDLKRSAPTQRCESFHVWERLETPGHDEARPIAYVLISKPFQMYAITGLVTDSVAPPRRVAGPMDRQARCRFTARPMPELEVPQATA